MPAGITEDEIMPPVATDGRATGDPRRYGNVSIFTPMRTRRGRLSGVLPPATFPLTPFMGMRGVAFASAATPTDPLLNAIPPTLGGGDIDIDLLGRAVVDALDFLAAGPGMDRAVAYAYLSAAANFEVSQVVDRTVGVHGVIRKADFD